MNLIQSGETITDLHILMAATGAIPFEYLNEQIDFVGNQLTNISNESSIGVKKDLKDRFKSKK